MVDKGKRGAFLDLKPWVERSDTRGFIDPLLNRTPVKGIPLTVPDSTWVPGR